MLCGPAPCSGKAVLLVTLLRVGFGWTGKGSGRGGRESERECSGGERVTQLQGWLICCAKGGCFHTWLSSIYPETSLSVCVCVLCPDTFVYVYNIFLSKFTCCNYINTVGIKNCSPSLSPSLSAPADTCQTNVFFPAWPNSDSQDIHTYINILHAEKNKPRSMVNPVMSWQRFSSH